MGKSSRKEEKRRKEGDATIRQTYQYHLLMLPGFIILFIYTIIPFSEISWHFRIISRLWDF